MALTQNTWKQVDPEDRPFEIKDDVGRNHQPGLLLRVQPSGVKTYYVQVARAKRAKIGRADRVTLARARARAGLAKSRHDEGLLPLLPSEDKAEAVTLRIFLDTKYEPWLREHRKSGADTAARIRNVFDEHLDRALTDFNKWIIDKHRTRRRKQGRNPETINREVSALGAALSKAVEWEILEAHPLKGLKPLIVDRRRKVRYLTDAEDRRLRRALKAREDAMREARRRFNKWRSERGYDPQPDFGTFTDHLRPAVLVLMNTGMRRGELFNLTWDNVNFRQRHVTLENTKSDQTRHVPMNKECYDTLQAWRAQQPKLGRYVFPSRDGEPMNNFRKSWTAILKAAKITGFRLHDLRHNFASQLVMQGVSLYVVKALLGHSSIDVTERYAHLAPDKKHEAVNVLDRLQSKARRKKAPMSI